MGESGTRREELGAVVGTRGAAVRGWTSEGFYKNNSLTDNLLASSLQRPQVPFGEGSFLFQLHRESPESQGWSLWVLIAFFPLFYQSAYSDEGKKGMKALQTLMKRSTNSFFFVDSPPAGRDELWRRKRSPSSSLFDWLTLRSAWRVWLLYHSVWWKHASQTCQKENPKTETQAQHVVSFKLFYCCFFYLFLMLSCEKQKKDGCTDVSCTPGCSGPLTHRQKSSAVLSDDVFLRVWCLIVQNSQSGKQVLFSWIEVNKQQTRPLFETSLYWLYEMYLLLYFYLIVVPFFYFSVFWNRR